MALTPRSFLRSPTLLVAAIVCGAIALLGVSVFMSVFCTASKPIAKCKRAHNLDRMSAFRTGSCAHVLNAKPVGVSEWTEPEFVDLASCLENAGEAELAVKASKIGIRYFPASEALHNVHGYNLIVLEQYDLAVHALRSGLDAVGQPTTGTLQNNLAWAGLYANDMMTLSEARKHYTSSLATNSSSCEATHTGLWVEYAIASRSNGASRDAAIDNYRTLRAAYAPCTSRAAHGDILTRYEVAGAGILDAEMTKLAMVQMFERDHDINEAQIHWKDFDTQLVDSAIGGLQLRTRADVQNACEQIAPVRSAQSQCRKSLASALR